MTNLTNAIKSTGVFYVATVEDDQPRVRPFSSVTEFNGKTYICTNNTKDVFKQIAANPKVEICGMNKNGTWLRVAATLVRDDSDDARAAMLADPTGPSSLYKLGDGIFEVFYLTDVKARLYSMTSAPVDIVD